VGGLGPSLIMGRAGVLAEGAGPHQLEGLGERCKLP